MGLIRPLKVSMWRHPTIWAGISSLIITLSLFFLLIDSLNGVLLRVFYFSIGQPYKFLVFILMAMCLLHQSYSRFLYFYWFVFLLLLPCFYTVLILGDSAHWVTDVNYSLKIAFIFLAFHFFRGYCLSEPFAVKRFERLIVLSFSVLTCNLLLGMFGYGFGQYDDIGSVGFFYAGNEVSGVMIILFSLVAYLVFMRKRNLYWLLALCLLILAIIKATKVAILGTVLVVFLTPLVAERKQLFVFSKSKLRYLIFFLFSLPIVLAFLYAGILKIGLHHRLLFFYEQLDLVTFLLSGRNLTAAAGFREFIDDYTTWEFFFGRGYYNFYQFVDPTRKVVGKVVEIDFFDLIFMYGLVGVVVIFSFWGYLVFRTGQMCFSNNQNFYAPPVFLSNLLLVFISFGSGHIMYSGMLGIFVGFSNGIVLADSRKEMVSDT